MVKLDVGKAAFAGFGVIGRNPSVVLGWSLFILVVGLLPALLLFGGFFGSVAQLAAADARGVEPTPEQIMPFFGVMFLAIPLLMIGGLLMRAMLTGAVFRAVLEPENRGWFYLRLGRQELWLILVSIVMSMLIGGVYMLLLIPVLPLSFLLQTGDPNVVAMIFLPLWVCVVIAVLGFLILRFSLALPMSFAERNFRLFESWTLTRGNGWNLLFVALLLGACLVALEAAVWLILVGVAAAVFGSNLHLLEDEARLQAFFDQDPSVLMQTFLPWIALAVVVGCLLGAVLTAVFTAPWAEAYRQLAAKPETPAA